MGKSKKGNGLGKVNEARRKAESHELYLKGRQFRIGPEDQGPNRLRTRTDNKRNEIRRSLNGD